MADLLLNLDGTGAPDYRITGGDLELDQTLRSNALAALFSDGRVLEEEDLPYGHTDPRGWWADTFEPVAPRRFGSLLWTVHGDKIVPDTLRRAQRTAEQALDWMIQAGIAERIEVEVSRKDTTALLLEVRIDRGDAGKYQEIWDQIAEELTTVATPGFEVRLLTT